MLQTMLVIDGMKKIVNYYYILNLKTSAEEKDIKKAYLALAQRYHPDKNSGNKLAEKKFKQINEAYQILKDPKKRSYLDLILKSSAEKTQPRSIHKETVLQKPTALIEKSLDLKISFPVSLEDLCQNRSCVLTYFQPYAGSKRKISLEVQIPPSSCSGTCLLFKNKGGAQGRKQFGDLYVKLQIKPHSLFKIKNQDVYFKLPVIFIDALLGKKLKIPTPHGDVLLQIQKNTKENDVLKLNKMGLPRISPLPQGDLFVKILVDYPVGEKIQISNKIKNLSGENLQVFLAKYKNNQFIYSKWNEYEKIYKKLKNENR